MLSYALCLVLLFWPLCARAHSSNWTYVASENKLVSLWEPLSTSPGLTIRIPGPAPPGWHQPRFVSASPTLQSGVWLLQTTPEQTDHDDVQTFESSHLLTNKPQSLIPAQASPGRFTSALNDTLPCSSLANHETDFVSVSSSCFSLHHTFVGLSQRGVFFSHSAPASSGHKGGVRLPLPLFRTPLLLQLLMFSILPLMFCGTPFQHVVTVATLLVVVHHQQDLKKDDNVSRRTFVYIIIINNNANKNLTSTLSTPDPPDLSLYSVPFFLVTDVYQTPTWCLECRSFHLLCISQNFWSITRRLPRTQCNCGRGHGYQPQNQELY